MKEIGGDFLDDVPCTLLAASVRPSAKTTAAKSTQSTTKADTSCNTCILQTVGLAQAMVASQPYTAPKSQEQSLICGTIFTDLSMPYPQGFHLWAAGKEV